MARCTRRVLAAALVVTAVLPASAQRNGQRNDVRSLQTTCQLFWQAAQAECPGQQGWLIQSQGKNFVEYVRASLPALRNPGGDPAGYATVLNNIDAGVNGVRQTLAALGLPAPRVRRYNEQIAEIVARLRNATAGPIPPPPPVAPVPPIGPLPPDGLSPADHARLARLLGDLSRHTQALDRVSRAVPSRDWHHNLVRNDVTTFAGEIEQLSASLRVGTSAAVVRTQLLAIRATAESIDRRIAGGRTDPAVTRQSQRTTASLNLVLQAAGIPAVGMPLPGVPGQPPPQGPVVVPPRAYEAVDRAAAECDAVSVACRPYQFHDPAVPQLLNELRDLRNNLAVLRQVLASGPTKLQVVEQMKLVENDLKSATIYRDQAARGTQINFPTLAGVSRAMTELNAALAVAN